MDLEPIPSTRDFAKCCNCGCSMIAGTSESWLRSVKRKYGEFDEEARSLLSPGGSEGVSSVARVGFENECAALREMVGNQQQAIQDLYTELEEERNAASTAANETMTMILRLQREKAEIQMEARQFKRFAEEKMEHDQQELLVLEDLLYKREQVIHSLSCDVQAYKQRLVGFGVAEAEFEEEKGLLGRNDSLLEYEFEYPPLRCNLNEPHGALEADYDDDDNDAADIEKYAFGETPRDRDRLKNLEHRIHQMERSPSNDQLDGDCSSSKNVLDKVVVGQTHPEQSRHARKFSNDSASISGTVKENGEGLDFGTSFTKTKCVSQPDEYVARKGDNESEAEDDSDTVDRVYTIDSVHNGSTYNGYAEVNARVGNGEGSVADPDIKKLYMRLQALEADRESMRQAILSMGTDKAQLVLLKEIAQQLCKDMSPERQIAAKKPSIFASWRFLPVFKWVMSFIFWRRKARRSKYLFGMSPNNPGLLMLLDKGTRTRPWRCLTSSQL